MNIPQDDGDLNAQYEAELVKFSMKPPKEVTVISEEEKQADYYKGFRSAVVLAWVFCNFALGAVVLSAAGLETFDDKSSSSNEDSTQTKRSMIYMEVVLWSVAALSMFKFFGAMWYLVVRMVSELSSNQSSFFQTFSLLIFSNTVPRRLRFTFSRTVIVRSALFRSCILKISHVALIPRRVRSGMVWYPWNRKSV